MNMKNSLILFIFLIPSLTLALTIESPKSKVHLIELFTSESCSSCPPAQDWLNALKKSPKLWKEIVPVGFHVDYWNHLSWKDPFSKEAYTSRQRNYARLMGSSTVFTPQLLLNGRRNLKSRSPYPERSSKIVGKLNVVYNEKSGDTALVLDKAYGQKLLCHGAVLGSADKRQISSGENSGKVLRHEFVAIGFVSAKSKRVGDQHHCRFKLVIETKNVKTKDKALAFWVSDPSTGEVIQAIGQRL